MTRRLAAVAITGFAWTIATQAALAAPAPLPEPRPSPIAIVIDTSGSMSESDGSPSGRIKIDGAKVALLDFLQQVEPNTPLGLRNYPAEGEATEGEEGCSEGKAQFAIQTRSPADMAARIRTLRADGNTPTAAALEAASLEIEEADAEQGTIVLVSDGESNCGRDPCEVAREIAESGIDLQTITVGFRVSGAGAEELQCIADQTGGKYLSVHDNEGLAEAFDEISRPLIHLDVSYPRVATAQVGNDPSGLVRIEAIVSNSGQRLARGVVARVGFDVAAGAPAVIRPVVHLGNLEPGESRKVAWVFRPSVPPDDRNPMPLPFTVISGAQNTTADAEFEATIQVRDAFASAADAGPILDSRERIAILGDSYSAGEGADTYFPGTDVDVNACHRSRHTYLFEAFGLEESSVIACSGALIGHFGTSQPDRTVGPQLEQLQSLRDARGVEAVALTIGGNDLGFGTITRSCLLGRADCSKRIVTDVPVPQLNSEPTDRFVGERIGALLGSLQSTYEKANAVVNTAAARKAAGGPVPILALAYPLPTPLTPQACPPMLDLLSAAEIEYLGGLATRLNGTIEEAAKRARDAGVPVFFVPNTEMAFQPDHTACHHDPYVRPLTSFNGAGVDYQALVDAIRGTVWRAGPVAIPNPVGAFRAQLKLSRAGFARLMRGINELVHPNKKGYAAETRALLRWSQSPDGIAAEQFLAGSPAAEPLAEVSLTVSDSDLGQLAPGPAPTLQGGTAYPLQLDGFAPDTPVEIVVRSDLQALGEATASRDGEISLEVGIPAGLDPGEHTLTVSGVGADGEPRAVEIPFRIAGGGLSASEALIWVGLCATIATALLALVAFVGSRRRGGLR